MERISSFSVDHRFLEPGLYVSMKQTFGESTITSFDIRITTPYREPVLSTGIIHTIEHIGATFLRTISSISNSIVYFGPMGCRTGFYLVLYGDFEPEIILPTIRDLFIFIRNFNDAIPGATIKECGNYTDMDLAGAKIIAEKYVEKTLQVIDNNHMHYSVLLN